MVYSEKLVAVIVVDDNILREIRNNGDDEVRVPFGTEYSIRLKNLNSTRAAVSVHVDGDDALDGSRIIIGPNEEHELKGFMQDNVVRNRFKFIEKTDKISEYRGDHIDDGIIRIEYQFEKKPRINENYDPPKTYRHPYDYNPWIGKPHKVTYEANPHISIGQNVVPLSNKNYQSNININTQNVLRGTNENGITVKGSQIHKEYNTTWLGSMEEAKHVITFHLKGVVENDHNCKEHIKVVKPLYTKTKITCTTCGTKSKSNCRFCSECGTSLL